MASAFQPGKTAGIDLGTTRSTLAHLDEYGKAAVIPNADAELVTPSVVLIDEGDVVIVGNDAKNQAVAAGHRVIRESKREIGRTDMKWEIDGKTYQPEMIGSMVLRKLKKDAEAKLGIPIVNAAITVPAYFDDSQRAATEAAGKMAGLNVVGILNEPVAAALAYGLDRQREDGYVVVYDLGGGTFDVSVMKVASGEITMVATDGNVELGGKDWDERIIARVVEKFMEEHGVDPTADEDTYQQLKNDAESAKESLTSKEKTRIIVQHAGHKLVYELTRQEFEQLTEDLLSQTEVTLTEVVEDQANLTWEQISRVLLVGGSSKMPQVARMVGELTGKQVSVGDPEPDLCVALGAAYYATILEVQQASDPNSTMTNQQKDEVRKKVASLPPAQAKAFTGTKVTMVTSHAYGVEVLDENHQTCNEVMIKKNSPLPASHSATFGLVHDNQTSVEINVWEGEESNLQFCTKAGTGEMSGFPPSPQGTPVEIQMEFTPEGVIKVRADCRGKTFEGTFERPQGMSAAEQEAAGRMMARMKVE
jgi:molecular chaperone DnaK